MSERPAVIVASHDGVPDTQLELLLLGLEEEGVPGLVERSGELNPLVLARSAASSSRLGVGVGVALGYVVVTLEKLPERRPYLAHRLGNSPRADRIIGSNAARLVKRLPLRDVDE
ncbi:MAG: glycerol dehydratase reactivase beta/small subunit family protein [Propionibacteriaceae bacterium]|nr:glycerol dehydratase reactivase beta/small subunit family protein [Propionibacteriaceae bacterium]